jgi:hypothetical protein
MNEARAPDYTEFHRGTHEHSKEASRNLTAKYPSAVSRLEILLRDMTVLPSVSSRDCPIDLPAKDRQIFCSPPLVLDSYEPNSPKS